jgi:hypothetical protein
MGFPCEDCNVGVYILISSMDCGAKRFDVCRIAVLALYEWDKHVLSMMCRQRSLSLPKSLNLVMHVFLWYCRSLYANSFRSISLNMPHGSFPWAIAQACAFTSSALTTQNPT